jgi:hypothetical protein
MDFNGMVRHYYLRNEPHMADLRVNLVHKKEREIQSHDFATQLRIALEPLAKRSMGHGSRWSRRRPGRPSSLRSP